MAGRSAASSTSTGSEKTKFRVDPGFYSAEVSHRHEPRQMERPDRKQRDLLMQHVARAGSRQQLLEEMRTTTTKRQAEAGIQTITFDAGEAKHYYDRAYEVAWATASRRARRTGRRMRALSAADASPSRALSWMRWIGWRQLSPLVALAARSLRHDAGHLRGRAAAQCAPRAGHARRRPGQRGHRYALYLITLAHRALAAAPAASISASIVLLRACAGASAGCWSGCATSSRSSAAS